MSDAPKPPRDDAFLPRSPLGQRKQTQPASGPERARIGEVEPAPTVVASEAPREPKWGMVGIAHEFKLHDKATQEYIIYRRVDKSVGYDPPSAEPPWSPSPNRPNTYEMVFIGPIQQVRTLADMGESLRTLPPASPDDSRLRKLDEAVAGLIREASRLQGPPGLGVGLLSPRNVLVTEEGQVILPDVGFYWKGGIIPPRWLIPEQEFRPLWDDVLFEAYAKRQEQCPVVAEILNVQTVARVIAAALTGTPARQVEPPAGSPAPIWLALADAAAGRVRTLRDLGQRLENTPPSQHYFYTPAKEEPPPRGATAAEARGVRLPVIVSGIVAVVAVIAGGVWFFLGSGSESPKQPGDGQVQVTPPPPTEQPKSEKPMDLATGISQFDQAKGAEQGSLLVDLLKAAKNAPTSQRQQVEPELTERRKRFLNDNWLKRYTKLQEEILTDQTRRFSLGQELRKLANELEQVRRFPCADPNLDAQEKQWLEYAQELARQLNLE